MEQRLWGGNRRPQFLELRLDPTAVFPVQCTGVELRSHDVQGYAEVFGSAGPLASDDGANLGLIGTRVTLTGAALRALIARVAPRLATVLGQKLAAQTVPVLGAAAGAATNYAYTRYSQEMAQVHFGLRRLAIEADRDMADMVALFREKAGQGRVSKG